MAVRVNVARAKTPYGKVGGMIHLPAGPVPLRLVEDFVRMARGEPALEVAAVIELHGGAYRLRPLAFDSRSASHVSYKDGQVNDDTLVIDLHSHGGGSAFFSSTDDASDLSRRGPYLAAVVGRCLDHRCEVRWRVVLPPYLVDVSQTDLVKAGALA